MRVISRRKLQQFWQKNRPSESLLIAWYTAVKSKKTDWSNFADVRAMFASTDLVGNCLVFDIGGNSYRLITRVIYSSHVVYILKVMTHAEYNKNKWKKECGCMSAPPRRKG